MFLLHTVGYWGAPWRSNHICLCNEYKIKSRLIEGGGDALSAAYKMFKDPVNASINPSFKALPLQGPIVARGMFTRLSVCSRAIPLATCGQFVCTTQAIYKEFDGVHFNYGALQNPL